MSSKLVTVGGGCFWCVEAIYQDLRGVDGVVSGYAGGTTKDPSYRSMGDHAEVIQFKYDSEIISFKEIMEIFFVVHDPTTLNRQGNDVGPQYRSIILYHDDEQKQIAEEVIVELEERKLYKSPIVTILQPYEIFYQAEDYHQNYFKNNPNQAYCKFVIEPKVSKFRSAYFEKLVKN